MEEIGSGIYNINRYLPLYSPGRKAYFMEDVIFTTTIPIPNLDDLQMRDMKKTTPQVTNLDTMQVTMQDTMKVRKLPEGLFVCPLSLKLI